MRLQYNFNEDRKVYNILGADVYPSSTGDPYDLKNKYITFYPTIINEALLSETTITDFPNSNNPNNKIISNIKNYYLNPQKQLTKQITTLSDYSVQETTYAYAFEKGNQKLLNANMISVPLEIMTLKRKDSTDLVGKMTSRLETIYPDQNNYPTSQTGNLLLPLSVQSYGFQSSLPSLEITYDKYDDQGNLSQYTDKGDFTTIIIWGYNQTQPIIKIEGAGLRVKYGTPSDLKLLLDQAINESNLDAAAGANNDETPLLSALTNVRNSTWLSDAQVTTYTHDSLIGLTSITSPIGIKEVYLYDSAHRLKEIRHDNATGKLLKEFKYNYKH
ncbi:hypothetical protein [Chryseobacterium sp. 5_R23647]|uniref:hypothetical protein n=1 Tax=Chryseobacterium sp. 5_R23647 TaxID=2258964 RepID=UPI000E24269F|nr:hypothetical protein [Chryseobacterium sp. 5_R23647]REC39943.1 hypothetical protein DRF69_20785 [Chryseobacterium sp. 5_R23647]